MCGVRIDDNQLKSISSLNFSIAAQHQHNNSHTAAVTETVHLSPPVRCKIP